MMSFTASADTSGHGEMGVGWSAQPVPPVAPSDWIGENASRLRVLCARASDLGEVSGTSWSRVRGPNLEFVCTDNQDFFDLAMAQADFGRGPALEARRTASPVVLASAMERGAEWPAWATAARSLGVHSAVALPLFWDGGVMGVLELVQRYPRSIRIEEVEAMLRRIGCAPPH